MKAYLPIFPDPEDQPQLSLIREGEDLALLKSLLDPAIEVLIGTRVPDPADYELLVTGRPERAYLEASSQLNTMLIPFAGLPEPTRALLNEFPHINVHNLHFNADETTEMALALLLSASKQLVPIDQKMRSGNWEARYAQPSASTLLSGKTALILGYGAIGQRLGRVLSAMNMNCIALNRSSSEQHKDSGVILDSINQLEDWLPKADVLMIAMPLTTQTENLIGSKQIQLLPDDTIIVNIGRAKIIDESALYNELASGRIRAGLDVWYQYPNGPEEILKTRPSKFDFEELENVVMSPHRGGHSREMQDRRMKAIADFINMAANQEPLPNQIDLSRGY